MRHLFLSSTAAALAWTTVAFGGCAPTNTRPNCVDLSAIPAIAQQVIGTEKKVAPVEKGPPSLPKNTYNGPTVGMSNAVRRAPEIGYRWDID